MFVVRKYTDICLVTVNMALATIFDTTPQDSHHKSSLLFDIAHRTSIGHCSDFDLRRDIIYIIGHVVLCVL